MTRRRLSASLAVAASVAGVAVFTGAVPTGITPRAHADQPETREWVNNARSETACRGLTPRGDLDNIAQQYANTEQPPQAGSYPGTIVGFLGSGDPFGQADNSALAKAQSAISNCQYTDFGVGFIRHDDRSVDVVTIVLGTPTVRPTPTQNQQPGPGLDDVARDVVLARSHTSCPALTYQTNLETDAQQYARTETPAFKPGQIGFLGSGDPIQEAINSVTGKASGALADCSNTSFGVGFIRHDDRSVDVVTVVLSK